MALTASQNATLKAHIEASPDLNSQPDNSDGDFEIARLLNLQNVPDFTIWKPSTSMDETMRAFTDADWTEVDGLTVGKARIWEWLLGLNTVSPAQTSYRAAVAECWKGTAARLATQARIFTSWKRLATRCERVLATGTGSAADPATASFSGSISYQDVGTARRS